MSGAVQGSIKQKAWIKLGLLAIGAGLLLSGPWLLPAAPALAQSARDMMSRLNRLENEVETLSRSVYKGEAPPPGAMGGDVSQANTEIRFQQMETEIRNLRGTLEEQSHEIRTLKSQIERMSADMDLRFQDLEKRANAPSQSADERGSVYRNPNPINTTASDQPGGMGYQQRSPETSPAVDPYDAAGSSQLGQLGAIDSAAGNATDPADPGAANYENAFSLLKNEQYDQAERAFLDFIQQNPGHVLTSNARYWLGETYYVRGNFEQAARAFAEGYQSDPKGAKSPDNLLKLGLSLASLGNQSDACIALGQIGKEFASGAGPVLRRAEQEMSRLGC